MYIEIKQNQPNTDLINDYVRYALKCGYHLKLDFLGVSELSASWFFAIYRGVFELYPLDYVEKMIVHFGANGPIQSTYDFCRPYFNQTRLCNKWADVFAKQREIERRNLQRRAHEYLVSAIMEGKAAR